MYFTHYNKKLNDKTTKFRIELFMCITGQRDEFRRQDIIPLDEILNDLIRSDSR